MNRLKAVLEARLSVIRHYKTDVKATIELSTEEWEKRRQDVDDLAFFLSPAKITLPLISTKALMQILKICETSDQVKPLMRFELFGGRICWAEPL